MKVELSTPENKKASNQKITGFSLSGWQDSNLRTLAVDIVIVM